MGELFCLQPEGRVPSECGWDFQQERSVYAAGEALHLLSELLCLQPEGRVSGAALDFLMGLGYRAFMGWARLLTVRSIGTVSLIISAFLLISGETIFKSDLNGGRFLLYWFVCFFFTGLALLSALVDLRSTRERSREKQKELLREMVRDLDKAPSPDNKARRKR